PAPVVLFRSSNAFDIAATARVHLAGPATVRIVNANGATNARDGALHYRFDALAFADPSFAQTSFAGAPARVRAIDVDRDGHVDLVVMDAAGAGAHVEVLFGAGTATV